MPNWCMTHALVSGDAEQAKALRDRLERILASDSPKAESDFGVKWLGNVLAEHGIDPDDVPCRGSMEAVSPHGDDGVEIEAETAWEETPLVLTLEALIRKCYPKLTSLLWYAEEPGCEYYQTNDTELRLCPGRYVIEHCSDFECDTYYANSEEQVLSLVGRLTGEAPESLDDVYDIEARLQDKDPDAQLSVHKVEFFEGV